MDQKQYILTVTGITVSRGGVDSIKNISFQLEKGDHLAITGPTGSGKTLLARALSGLVYHQGSVQMDAARSRNIVWIEQEHHFRNRSNTNDFYYQQRFNSFDAEDALTVAEYLGDTIATRKLFDEMKIGYLANKPLIQLSNGENKKVQVALALLQQPSLLILDQPFTGLDTETRAYLHRLLQELSTSITLLLITSPGEIPSCFTRVIELDKGSCARWLSATEYKKEPPRQHNKRLAIGQLPLLLSAQHGIVFEIAIGMKNVQVEYQAKKILQHIDWTVRRGERWLLSGPNGAGKSTLLSLVTADNPQAYANDILLFDRQRGSGESIWDIKKRIGFLSPELHLHFDQACTGFETVASGLYDTIGLFRQPTGEETELVLRWMDTAGAGELSRRRLAEMSVGQQRVLLLLRALVKDPPLLILDEPCQGLDDEKQDELLELINQVCLLGEKTLVFVTHYAEKKPACVDRALRLNDGRIEWSGLLTG